MQLKKLEDGGAWVTQLSMPNDMTKKQQAWWLSYIQQPGGGGGGWGDIVDIRMVVVEVLKRSTHAKIFDSETKRVKLKRNKVSNSKSTNINYNFYHLVRNKNVFSKRNDYWKKKKK